MAILNSYVKLPEGTYLVFLFASTSQLMHAINTVCSRGCYVIVVAILNLYMANPRCPAKRKHS